MKNIFDSIFSECYERAGTLYSFQEQLALLELKGFHNHENKAEMYPIKIKVSSLMLVISGEMNVSVDYRSYTLKKNTIMQLSMDNIIENITNSSDFKGYQILFSNELTTELMAQTFGIRRPKSRQLKRNYPIHKLTEDETKIILERIELIKKYMIDEMHFYRSAIIKNEVINLQYELDNSRRKKYGDGNEDRKILRNETLREQFRDLLLQKCKEHHDVSFYAGELCVTPDYLSRVVREYDGQSAMKWISNAVVTESKILLRQPNKSINEVAMELNFPDQSTFGKFFKRYMSISPVEFKKKFSAR